MDTIKLRELQQRAIQNVMARTSEAVEITMSTRVERFDNLHIAAFMDIDKTTDSLKQILEYKKEIANQMLLCSDEKQMEQLANILRHAENMIKNVLGMCV